MVRNYRRKTRRRNNKLKIASITGAYDAKDYRDDKQTLQGLSGAAMTPKLEKSIDEILKRMKRRSWD